jgi:hypothetical protein
LSFDELIVILLNVLLGGGLECPGRLLDEVDDGAILCFEAAAFGFGHALVGNLERGEVDEGLARPLQALL